jgi:hypothetical protein
MPRKFREAGTRVPLTAPRAATPSRDLFVVTLARDRQQPRSVLTLRSAHRESQRAKHPYLSIAMCSVDFDPRQAPAG